MRHLIFGLFLLASAGTALAGAASDRLFLTTALQQIDESGAAVYRHVREGTLNGAAMRQMNDGEIRVAVHTADDKSREAVVTMGDNGKSRPVGSFPASSGNPVLPIFLESVLRSMARATGGSEFYIRNRMKESLGAGETMETVELDVNGQKLEATHVVIEPFLNDKNRERMGDFANLKLHFFVSDKVPGDIVRFIATTGDEHGEVAYRESISFLKLAEAK